MVKYFVILALFSLKWVFAQPAIQGEILFTTTHTEPESVAQLYLLNTETSELTLLADSVLAAGQWSPDGQRIVYSAGTPETRDIYLLDIPPVGAEMSVPHPVRLTMSPDNEILPVWSPDGQRIAFISQANSERQIHIMSAEGADKQRIAAQFQVSPYSGLVWAQNGTKLLFQMTNNMGFHPFVMVDLESGEWETFTALELGENYTGCGFAWSDASQNLIANLAVETDCVSGGPAYLMTLENPVFDELTLDENSALSSYSYDWSSDGKTLAFVRSTDPFGVTQQLYSLNPDSRELQALTGPDDLSPDGTGGYQKISVDWSPDQRWLAFAWVFGEPLKHQAAIYVVASDGSELRQISPLLENISSIGGVAWRPS